MKMVKIRPVTTPKSFADVKFTKTEHEAAMKAGLSGVMTVPYFTAMENIRNSRGLYELVPDELPKVNMTFGGNSLEEMESSAIKLLALKMGVTIRKKNMRRSELIALVKTKMDEIEILDDDEPDGDEPDPETDAKAE